jgi:hypothetical protein
LFEALSDQSGRSVRSASDRELALHRAISQHPPTAEPSALSSPTDHDQQEAI